MLAPDCGLLVAAEPAERGDWNGEPHAHRIPEQNGAWVRNMGGHAVKFLVQLRPDRPHRAGTPDLVEDVLSVVREVAADCRAHGIPSVIENLDLPPARRGRTVARATRGPDRRVGATAQRDGRDLLKLEYPGSAKGCRRVADVIDRPWAVLSAGVPFADFQHVVRVACDEGGVSGFIAGRSIWREAVGITGQARAEFLDTVAKPRLTELVDAVHGRARPWKEAVTP